MQVQPYLWFDGRCAEALEFYRRALGAEVTLLRHFKDSPDPGTIEPGTDDKVMHASFRIGQTTVLASDGRCQGRPSFEGFALALTAADEAEAERRFKALAEGGQIQQPLTRTFLRRALWRGRRRLRRRLDGRHGGLSFPGTIAANHERRADAASRALGQAADAAVPVVAIQMPANTPIRPTIRLAVIGSPTSTAASSAAATGFDGHRVGDPGRGRPLQRQDPEDERERAAGAAEVEPGEPFPGAKAAEDGEAAGEAAGQQQPGGAGPHADAEKAERARPLDQRARPDVPMHWRKGDLALNLFTTITTFGTPQDITLEELRVECFFPTDEATAQAFRAWAAESR